MEWLKGLLTGLVIGALVSGGIAQAYAPAADWQERQARALEKIADTLDDIERKCK